VIDGFVLLATVTVVVAVVLSTIQRPVEDSATLTDDELLLMLACDSSPAFTADQIVAPRSSLAASQSRAAVVAPSQTRRSRRFSSQWRATSVPVAACGLAAGLGLVALGQSMLLRVDHGALAVVLWFAGLLVIAALYRQIGVAPELDAIEESREKPSHLTILGAAAILFVATSSFSIWRRAHDRPAIDASVDIVVLWVASIAALTIACTGPPRRAHLARLRAWASRNRGDILLTAGIAAAALIPRVYALGGNPWAMSGDEGTFGVTARSVLRGELSNPFTSGPWGYPSMLFILQGRLMEMWGETVGGARFLSALLGTGSVVAIYWLSRHHLGRWVGLVAAAIGIVFHFELFWSRNAQNASAPMLFIPLALLFLDRGLIGHRRVDTLAAGLTIGFAQFFHPANRILFPMAATYVAYALVHDYLAARRSFTAVVRDVLPNAIWVTAAAAVAHVPLLSYFSTHRMQFSWRSNEVSVFASGWLEREHEITGLGPLHILWIQFQNAALLPFNTIPHGHFRPEPPFAGWPLVIPLAIGMAIASLAFWERRYFGLVMGFWATVVGIALTDGPPQTNRYTSSAPFLVIFAAFGIVAVAQITVTLVRVPRWAVAGLAGATVLVIVVWNLDFTFSEPNNIAVASDTNTQIANHLARDAEAHGDGLTVYFSGGPQLYYEGFQNIPFIADGATGIDVDEPWDAANTPPELTGPTLFAFVANRSGELDAIRSWFPNGQVKTYSLPDGEPILTTYFVDAPDVEAAPAT
jgi:hypothetical protein